jgi:hypothetical protein
MTDQLTDREARADHTTSNRTSKASGECYGKRASAYKNWTQLLGLVVIAAGAATSFF